MIPSTTPVTTLPSPPAAFANASVPGSTTVRPPYDNIVPSVSTAAVGNDARGNNAGVSPSQSAPVQSQASSFSAPVYVTDAAPDGIATAQTNFFAQLLGQGGGDEARALLVVYEKLVQIAQVRYMPSNAGVPAPEPAGAEYARLLQQEKTSSAAPLPAAPVQTKTVEPSSAGAIILPVIKTSRDTRAIALAPTDSEAETEIPDVRSYDITPSAATLPPKAADAYVATIVRNNVETLGKTAELA